MSNLPSKKKIGKKSKKMVKKVIEKASIAGTSNVSAKTVNKVAKMGSKVMGAGYNFAGFTPKKGMLRDRLQNWLEALARPFDMDPQKCPVNFNPMPTLQTTVMRTTVTEKIAINAGQNFQYVLFPGHTAPVDADELDGPSYHQNWQALPAGAVYPVGPMQYADAGSVLRSPIIGVKTWIAGAGGGGTISSGVCQDTSSTGGAYTNQPIVYDVAVPFTGSAKNGYHTRYKLTAMSVKFLNETPEVNRGGNYYSVQPLNSVSFPAINQYALYTTFHDHGLCDQKEGTVSWIPRVQDLSFYHPSASTSYTIGIGSAGIILWFVNNTAYNQNLSIEVVCHWEVGGQNLQTMATAASQMPSDNNVVTPTISYLQQGSHTAAPAPRVAEVVATAASPWKDTFHEIGKAAGKVAAEVAFEKVKSHIPGPLGIRLAPHLATLF